jgi:hypothetical protein
MIYHNKKDTSPNFGRSRDMTNNKERIEMRYLLYTHFTCLGTVFQVYERSVDNGKVYQLQI